MNLNVMTPEDATRIAESVKKTAKTPQQIAEEGQARTTGSTPQVSADDVYTKIVKFIPTPLIGLYLLLINLFLSGIDSKRSKEIACWITFVVFGVLIAVFLHTRAVRRPAQIAASVLAYAAWATASPGPFQLISGWKEWIGTAALIVVIAAFMAWNVKPLPDSVLQDSTI